MIVWSVTVTGVMHDITLHFFIYIKTKKNENKN